ncbi:hypothetical protein [Gimesia maris]|nr:hypothetical protein [Gimesia maris]
MSYSDYTFQDKNPVKRWLQQRRMVSATRLGQQTRTADSATRCHL